MGEKKMTGHTSHLKPPDPAEWAMRPTGEYPFSSLMDGYSDSCTPLIHSFFGLFPNAFADRGEIQKEGNWKKDFFTGHLTDDARVLKEQKEKLEREHHMFSKVIINPHFFDRLDELADKPESWELTTTRDRADLFFNNRARFHPYRSNELGSQNQIVACQCCNRDETATAWNNTFETADKLSASKNYGKTYSPNDLLMFEMGDCHEWYTEERVTVRNKPVEGRRVFTKGIYFFCWSCVHSKSKYAPSAPPLITMCEHHGEFEWVNQIKVGYDPEGSEVRLCNDCYHDNISNCERCGEIFYIGTEGSGDFMYWEHDHIGSDCTNVCCECFDYLQEAVIDWERECEYELEREENEQIIQCYSTRILQQDMRSVRGRDLSKVHQKMIGVELECECRPDRDRYAIAEQVKFAFEQITDSRNFVIVKNDSSLSRGFEIVSTTATLSVHNYVWSKFLTLVQNAIHNKLSSHDKGAFGLLKHLRSFRDFDGRRTCGIHVHLDRTRGEITDLQHRKMDVALNCIENRKLVTTVAQRPRSTYCEYDGTKTMQSSYDNERYSPVNATRDTLEIRIFNGTLLPNSMLKSIQFADFIRHYSRQNANAYRRLRNGWFLRALEKQVDTKTGRREYDQLLDYVVEHRNKYKDSEHVQYDSYVGQFLDYRRGYRNSKPLISPLELPSKYNRTY